MAYYYFRKTNEFYLGESVGFVNIDYLTFIVNNLSHSTKIQQVAEKCYKEYIKPKRIPNFDVYFCNKCQYICWGIKAYKNKHMCYL